MRSSHPRFLFLLTAGLALSAAPASAQTVSGSVEGTIQDSQGGRLPGVNVELRSTETGQVRTTVTNRQGFFQISFVPIGRYRASTDLAGFGRKVREIEVSLNSTRVVDLTLAPSIAEEVVVTADAPRINTTSGTIQSSLTSEQIMEKPTVMNLNNVNQFLSLAETFAGFQENPTSGQNNPTASSGSSINFNGTGTRGSTFQINGVNNDDYSENQNRQGVPLATIKEFQVVSNSYSAEFGRGYGAVVLVQTKQGTNAIKGEAYFSRQDNDFNERLFFAPFPAQKPVNSRNVFGAVLGAPIKKDKLFAFVSIEHARRSGEQNYTRDLITAADRALPRLTRGNDTPANRAFIDSVLARFGSLVPNDPRSTRTYAGIQEFDQPVRDYSARLDYNMSSKDHVTARFQFSKQLFTSDDVIVGEAPQQRNDQKNFGVTYTRTFSSRATGEFRYGLGIRDTNVEIKDGNTTPVIRFAGSPVAGSTIGNAGTFPILRDQLDHQFVYNFTTLMGNRHLLKVGTDIRFSKLDDVSQSQHRGFWNFGATCGGQTYSSAYAAFFDGCVTTFTKAYGPDFLENRLREYNFYAQDDFKLRPNLTLNLGLRYEIAGAPTEAKNRIDYGYQTDKNNVGPRLGFAWAPSQERGVLGKLFGGASNGALRGGYGIYHGRLFQSNFSQSGASVRTNPPNAASTSFTGSTNLADPTNGFVFQPGAPQTVRVTLAQIDPSLHMPYTHQWNLTFERKIPWNSSMRITYNGTRGKDMVRNAQVGNLPVAPGAPGSTYVLAADYLCAGTGTAGVAVNTTCPNPVPIAANEISARVQRVNERRPDARYNTNFIVSNSAESWYDGVQIEWLKRVSSGFDFQLNYTRSVAKDTTSEATFVGAGDSNQLGPDPKFAKGYSRFHTPHRFALNGTYRLPFLAERTDLAGQILGGWRLAFVLKLASGTPFTVTDTGGVDLNFDGFTENRPALVDPSIVGVVVNNPDTSTQRLVASAFRRATPADLASGLSPRNGFFGDGLKTLDLALSKTFKPVGKHQLIVRLEGINVTNAVHFSFPNTDFASVNFGRITGTSSAYIPRTLQATMRYVF